MQFKIGLILALQAFRNKKQSFRENARFPMKDLVKSQFESHIA